MRYANTIELQQDMAAREKERKAAVKEAKRLRKELERLSGMILVFLHQMDTKIGPDKTIPRAASSNLGALTGWLDMKNDLARQAVGLDFTAKGKKVALERLMRSNVSAEPRRRRRRLRRLVG